MILDRQARDVECGSAADLPFGREVRFGRRKTKLSTMVIDTNALDTLFLTSPPQGRDKFATILSEEVKRLLAMHRYERLVLFRRKIAIQAFDESSASQLKLRASGDRDRDQASRE